MMLLSSKNLLDYVQNHSSNLRSGLDYTNMYLDNIIGFKRPKLKSATRMVNYDFDQIDRFLNYAKFFYHPHYKVEMSKVFLIIILSTKLLLQIYQKTTVSTNFVNEVFYEAKGMNIMDSILSNFKEDTLFRGIFFLSSKQYVIKKPKIKHSNLTKGCRIIKEGHQPGSILAKSLIESSIEKWPSSYGPRFVTSNYMLKTTSKVAAKILKR